MSKLKKILDRFNAEIGTSEVIIRVPGRANIIGEHIDYCDACVLPFAIEQSMYFVARKRSDNIINVNALDADDHEAFQIRADSELLGWRSFFAQTINMISLEHNIGGADIYFASDIPVGAGVSSSSAICVGIISTLDGLYNIGISKNKMVDIASQAEYGIGIRGGIMDQYTILHGKENHALLIDCNNGSHVNIDLSDIPQKWILLNTNVKHNLVNTPYNDRRSQVEQALKLVNERTGIEKTFSDINISDIRLISDYPILSQRLQHIHNEIRRVDKAVNCIKTKNYIDLGQLLSESHHSLSSDYEVSCAELDFVCANLLRNKDVLGARMMGGGFGGSVIALVNDEFDDCQVVEAYKNQFGIELDVISVAPSSGVEIIE